MTFFESLLALLLIAIVLLQLARRLSLPYPTMLAGAGVIVAMIPKAPSFSIDPSTCLALFIAPAVVDAAFDFPPDATRRFIAPLVTYAVIAVVLTTAVVAWISWAVLRLPLAAGIALGAVVSPPDAAAATAVLTKIFPASRNRGRTGRRESLQRCNRLASLWRRFNGSPTWRAFFSDRFAPRVRSTRRPAIRNSQRVSLRPRQPHGERHFGRRSAPVRDRLCYVDHRGPPGSVGRTLRDRVRHDPGKQVGPGGFGCPDAGSIVCRMECRCFYSECCCVSSDGHAGEIDRNANAGTPLATCSWIRRIDCARSCLHTHDRCSWLQLPGITERNIRRNIGSGCVYGMVRHARIRHHCNRLRSS